MAKGRYIKSAERACASKARYETALDAERACDWRFRAYQCPVCHGYHLTSQPGNRFTDPLPPAAKAAEPGPKLADLDWSAALDPKSKAPRQPKPKKPARPAPPPEPPTKTAKCVGEVARDGRVLLVLDGRIVKSEKVRDPDLRSRLHRDVEVRVSLDQPPRILGTLSQPS